MMGAEGRLRLADGVLRRMGFLRDGRISIITTGIYARKIANIHENGRAGFYSLYRLLVPLGEAPRYHR